MNELNWDNMTTEEAKAYKEQLDKEQRKKSLKEIIGCVAIGCVMLIIVGLLLGKALGV